MPIYEARCGKCGKHHDYFQPISNRADTPECCGERSEKVILNSATAYGDTPSYQSPIDGKWIDGRKARKEDMKRSGSRPWEGMEAEKKEASRFRAEADQQFNRRLDERVERTYYELPASKRRALA